MWQKCLLAQTLGASLVGEARWNQAETTKLDELLAFTNACYSPREINIWIIDHVRWFSFLSSHLIFFFLLSSFFLSLFSIFSPLYSLTSLFLISLFLFLFLLQPLISKGLKYWKYAGILNWSKRWILLLLGRQLRAESWGKWDKITESEKCT